MKEHPGIKVVCVCVWQWKCTRHRIGVANCQGSVRLGFVEYEGAGVRNSVLENSHEPNLSKIFDCLVIEVVGQHGKQSFDGQDDECSGCGCTVVIGLLRRGMGVVRTVVGLSFGRHDGAECHVYALNERTLLLLQKVLSCQPDMCV